MKKVVLLKNKTVPQDPYDITFRNNGYEPVFVPLLKHQSMNESLIADFLKSEEYLSTYKALIITSQRCIETLDTILEILKEGGFDIDPVLSKTAYTVGPATYKVLQNLGFKDIRGGPSAGNGGILADLIAEDDLFNEDPIKKVLFLTGEIRKDIIPRKLLARDFALKELVSYRTIERADIMERFHKAAPSADWVVFFSPQGTEDIVDKVKDSGVDIATIGPTTEEYLKDKGLDEVKVARKPTAQYLFEALAEDSQ